MREENQAKIDIGKCPHYSFLLAFGEKYRK
jgi:hypothetical protein